MAETFLQRGVRAARSVWVAAKREHATPGEIAWAVGLGAWIGASPLLGVRTWVAVAAATAVKKNRAFAFLGAHLTSNWLFTPWIALAEIQAGHHLRAGAWLPLTVDDVTAQGPHLLTDWVVGYTVVGPPAGVLFGVLGLLCAHDYARRVRHRPPAP